MTPAKHHLHTVEYSHEDIVAVGGRGLRRLDHEAHSAGRALAQAAAGLVGDVTRLCSRFQNAPPGFGIDVEASMGRFRSEEGNRSLDKPRVVPNLVELCGTHADHIFGLDVWARPV